MANLIKSTAELKKYIAIDVNTKFATFEPFVNDAEELHLLPLLGQAFFDELKDDYASASFVVDDISDANVKALFPYVQRVIAYYAMYAAINQVGVNLGDLGIQQTMGESSQPAPLWKVEKLEFNAILNADTFADKLLAYLESKALSGGPFANWYSSTANTKLSGAIVYGTDVARKYIHINDSRRIFLFLKQHITEVESRIVPKLIGPTQYAKLVTELKANNTSTAEKALIAKLEPIIAKMALYIALPYMRVSVGREGFTMYSSTNGVVSKQIATEKELTPIMERLKGKPFGYQEDEEALKQFYIDNIADYPLIADTTLYTVQPDPGPTYKPENLEDNKHFSV